MAFVQIIEFRTFDIDPTRQINKETRASAEQHMKTSEGPPVFYDLDILEDRA
jgi:hypothetical protein